MRRIKVFGSVHVPVCSFAHPATVRWRPWQHSAQLGGEAGGPGGTAQRHQTGGQGYLAQGTRGETQGIAFEEERLMWRARPVSQCHQTGGHIHPCQGTRRETHDTKCLRGKVGRDRGWRTRLQHPSFIKLVDRHLCQGTRGETHDTKCLRGKVGGVGGWRTRLQHPNFISLVDRDTFVKGGGGRRKTFISMCHQTGGQRLEEGEEKLEA